MSVTFAGDTIVSDSTSSAYYGGAGFVAGDIEDEIYQFTIPRANGTGEKTSGNKRRHHALRCQWFSTDEKEVRSKIDEIRMEKKYGTLSIPNYSGNGYLAYPYCRLERVEWGGRQAGYRDGSRVTVFSAVLYFIQVR